MLTVFSNPGTPTSQSFINSIVKNEVPEDLILDKTLESGVYSRLVRVSFIGKSAGEPIISSLIKSFDIKVNILYGNIDRIKDIPFGNLVLELIGDANVINEGLAYLRDQGLEIEVLKNV